MGKGRRPASRYHHKGHTSSGLTSSMKPHLVKIPPSLVVSYARGPSLWCLAKWLPHSPNVWLWDSLLHTHITTWESKKNSFRLLCGWLYGLWPRSIEVLEHSTSRPTFICESTGVQCGLCPSHTIECLMGRPPAKTLWMEILPFSGLNKTFALWISF